MVSLFFAFWGDLKILGVPRNLGEAVLIIFLSQIAMNLVSKLLFPHVEPAFADGSRLPAYVGLCRLMSAFAGSTSGGGTLRGRLNSAK